MDEYERLVRLSARLKDQMTKMSGLLAADPLREAKHKVERQISELLLAEAATALARPQWETPFGDGSLITASRTKAESSAAASVPPTPPSETGAITPMIPRSLRLLGAVMEVELIHADHCFECRDLQARLSSWLSMHVPVAGGIKTQEGTPSTSAKQAQPSSAGHRGAGHAEPG